MEANKENPKKRFDAEAFEKAMKSYLSGEHASPSDGDEDPFSPWWSWEMRRKLDEILRQEKQRES